MDRKRVIKESIYLVSIILVIVVGITLATRYVDTHIKETQAQATIK